MERNNGTFVKAMTKLLAMKLRMSLEKIDFKLLIVLFLGFLFRFILIDLKPPHFDEGVNGWFVDQIFETGFFKYDPTNYHGPLHFYILAFFKIFLGRSLLMLRISSVLFGIGVIYLGAKVIHETDTRLKWFCALLLAISPGMIFYSRYGIHEMGFLFFSLLAVYAYLNKNASLFLTGFVGMLLMKETWVIFAFSFFIAALATKNLYHLKFNKTAIWAAMLILVVFFTGFFKNPEGVIDFFRTYIPWYNTGIKGNGHEKAFFYWLKLFMLYEPFAVVGVVGAARYMFLSNKKYKFLAVFSFVQLFVYSIIPYKTPWCIVQILWPFYLFSVLIFRDLLKSKKLIQMSMAISIFILFSSTITKAISLNFINYTNESEPYVYVQTHNDIKNIMKLVLTMPPETTTVKVAMQSQWPLPWLLGDYKKIEYYGSAAGLKAGADIVFCDASLCDELKNTEFKLYFAKKMKLRAAMDEVVVYFSRKKFKNGVNE